MNDDPYFRFWDGVILVCGIGALFWIVVSLLLA